MENQQPPNESEQKHGKEEVIDPRQSKSKRSVSMKPNVTVISENDSEISYYNPSTTSSYNQQPGTHYQVVNEHTRVNGLNYDSGLYVTPHNGYVNNGYMGSSSNLGLSSSTSSVDSAVVKEQYWDCPCSRLRWGNWTQREKIMVIILSSLTFIIVGLIILITRMTWKGDTQIVGPPWAWTL